MKPSEEFPDEVLEDILVKLTVKNLVRFMCVSKQWQFLLTSPAFARLHLHHNQYHSNSLIVTGSSGTYASMIDLENIPQQGGKDEVEGASRNLHLQFQLFPSQQYYNMTSCDGILCIALNCETLLLWNPCINEYKRLAVPERFISRGEALALGYDSSINDYKVVRFPSRWLIEHIGRSPTAVEVLTVKSNSWRRVSDYEYPYLMKRLEQEQAVAAADGGLYWFAYRRVERVYFPDSRKVLIRFDLAEETTSEVAMPPNVKLHDPCLGLGVSGGCLSLISEKPGCYFLYLELWVMKEKTWVKFYDIRRNFYINSHQNIGIMPLCLGKDGALPLLVVIKDHWPEPAFLIYDPEHKTYRKFLVPEAFYITTGIILHSHSLISPSTHM